jgi:hypothetical protein
MADNAQTPGPGTHPDAVVINDDGSVSTRPGKKAWVWVTDEGTGARYDVPASMLPRSGITPVPGYPVNYEPHARTPKPALALGDVGGTAGAFARAQAQESAGEIDPKLVAARASVAALGGTTDDPDLRAAGDDQDTAAVAEPAGDAQTTTTKSRKAGAR